MAKKKTQEGDGYVVTAPFRDINNWEVEYAVGADANHFDEERLESLIGKGLVGLKSEQKPADE